jgi:choline/glycine/proline betaine transport protein
MPLTIRTVLVPLLGKHIHGPLGDAVDIFAVLGTMFGVATSLGLGAQQVNAGMHHLVGAEIGAGTQLWLIAGITAIAAAGTQLWLIAGITAIAAVSVVSGLDRGIRRLSQINIWLALGLFVYVLLAGPTGASLRAAVLGSGRYLASLFQSGFWADFGGDLQWQGDWTLFYWGWWIAWSPFVGMFVARVSRGRTIREFVIGVLLVPTAMTCVWFAVFGGAALHGAVGGESALAAAVETNVPVAIYVFFEGLPLSGLLAVVGTAVVVFFFVTSSDSASLVIDYLTAGGDLDPPKRQRLFWAVIEGLVAAILLLTGGLAPMRTFQLTTGLPLCLILLLTCLALVRGLRQDPRAKG